MKNNENITNPLGIDKNVQDEKVQEFKCAMGDESISLEEIIDKYLLNGIPYVFNGDEYNFFDFKKEIAKFFNVSQTNIFVVGSAKLGFSIAPNKRYILFNEDSDIDVAIIDEDTFLRYWKILYEYNTTGRAWSINEEKTYRKFLEYFFKGWLRPDKFPSDMKERVEWFDFFKSMQKKYKFKIAAGIYYDIDVFNEYHKENLNSIREDIKNG